MPHFKRIFCLIVKEESIYSLGVVKKMPCLLPRSPRGRMCVGTADELASLLASFIQVVFYVPIFSTLPSFIWTQVLPFIYNIFFGNFVL